ncbi:similar to monocarboxylate permease-like protein [Plenodomus lingam JN3]|uniref:Similar to monocarboxylate permease-like protein n=1 Tax=Leptosphaeria maculans (strain JN3 / isolate v23.1.3 / race Av1-4-5-6-7-8) TaxID=985895 RepID=E5A733_LEPMJ|nr:similar to monocarboxylate permease-like protein [Plenodomus lingam JN3]CBX99428.1 similar to monocarboxylate permease-like protein [Plenodomus lingam JN3]
MISILPTYSNTRLGLATGIASSGSSMGVVVYPIVIKALMYKIGFSWTTRVLGLMAMSMLIIPVVVMRERRKPAARLRRDLIDRSAFTDVPFVIFVLATMIGFIGLTVALFYLSLSVLVNHLADEDLSFNVLSLYNAASVFSRIAPNILSDRVGQFNVITPCALVTGILLFCLASLRPGNVGAVISLTILWGFFGGVFVAIPGACFPRLTKGKSRLGTRVGMGFSVIGFGMLIGGPGAGRILDPSANSDAELDFVSLWMFGGVVTVVSGFLYLLVRLLLTGRKLMVKA